MPKQKVKAEEAETVENKLMTPNPFTLLPETVEQAMKLSELIAASDLAPKNFKDKPGNCYIAIQMGMEVGLSPMQSIQNICVINGRPAIYGDLGKGLLLSKGCKIEERDIKEIRVSGEACCRITRKDGRFAMRTYSIEDAGKLVRKEGPWQTDKYRMLAWRAFWFAARDVAADLLHSLTGVEEVRDYVETEALPPIPEPQRASTAEEKKEETAPTNANGPMTDNSGPNKPDPAWILITAKKESECGSCADEVMPDEKVFWDKPKSVVHHVGHFA